MPRGRHRGRERRSGAPATGNNGTPELRSLRAPFRRTMYGPGAARQDQQTPRYDSGGGTYGATAAARPLQRLAQVRLLRHEPGENTQRGETVGFRSGLTRTATRRSVSKSERDGIWLLRRPGDDGPWHDGRGSRHDRHGSSCERGNRGYACGGRRRADRCVSCGSR